MKKSIFAVILLVIVSGLLGEAHDNSEYENFQKYQEEQTITNLISALQYYDALGNETGKLMTAYLHSMALDSSLAALAAEGDSLSMKTRFSYANLLLDLGRYEECLPIYESLNTESPAWACPWRHKGEALWKQGDLEAAEKALGQSIIVRENHYDAYVMLAEVQLEAGKAKEALATLEAGLKYRSENPEYSEDDEFEQNVKELHEKLIKLNGRKE